MIKRLVKSALRVLVVIMAFPLFASVPQCHHTPAAIGHLGEGSGTFSADPSWENAPGVLSDVLTVGAVLSATASALPSLNGSAAAAAVPKTETVQRAMSRAELENIRRTGTLTRGGRAGDHYASDAVNSTAGRTRQRLALPNQPDVRVTLEVPQGIFSSPSKVRPYTLPSGKTLPGGGMERIAPGNVDVPVRIINVLEY
jgi:hypothetical protein